MVQEGWRVFRGCVITDVQIETGNTLHAHSPIQFDPTCLYIDKPLGHDTLLAISRCTLKICKKAFIISIFILQIPINLFGPYT